MLPLSKHFTELLASSLPIDGAGELFLIVGTSDVSKTLLRTVCHVLEWPARRHSQFRTWESPEAKVPVLSKILGKALRRERLRSKECVLAIRLQTT